MTRKNYGGVVKLAVVIALPIIVYMLVTQFFLSRQTLSVDLSYMGYQQGGGGCRSYPLYDQDGVLYEAMFWHVEYTGPAPLYSPDLALLNTVISPNDMCPVYPDKISPSIAVTGEKIYPLHFTVNEADNRKSVLSGESFVLIAKAEFTDYFGEDDLALSIPPHGYETVALSLQAPSFDYEPTNEVLAPLEVSLGFPTEQRWVLSPEASAIGDQTIIMTAKTDWANASWLYQLDLKIESIYGVDPKLAGKIAFIFTTIGGLVTFFFSNISDYLSIKKMKKELDAENKEKGRKTQNRRQKTKKK